MATATSTGAGAGRRARAAQALRGALEGAQLRRFQAASAANALGQAVFTVALALAAYDEGGAGALGAVWAVRLIPSAAAAPVTALLTDRRSRRGVLVAACGASAALVALLAAAASGDGRLWAIMVLATAATMLGTAIRPAQAALLPGLSTTPQQLAGATAVWNTGEHGSYLVGSLVAGLVAAALSPAAALVGAAGALALAAAAFATLAPDPPPAHRAVALDEATTSQELSLGLAEVRADAGLREAARMLGALAMVDGLTEVLAVAVCLELLDLGDAGVGTLNAVFGVGGLTGGAMALGLLGRGRFAAASRAGALAVGLPLAALAAAAATPVAVIAWIGLGIGYALTESTGQVLFQRLASDEALGRAFGVIESLAMLAAGAGGLLAGVLVDAAGVRGSVALCAAVLPVLALARRRAVAQLDARGAVPAGALATLRATELFGVLPLATVETLAVRAERVAAPAGTVIVRQGDAGRTFYVIEDGRVEVEQDGGLLRHQGPGESFGEIALLRDVPRTATVTATADTELLALGREDFLAAVTGHRRASRTADDVAEVRLATVPAPRPEETSPA